MSKDMLKIKDQQESDQFEIDKVLLDQGFGAVLGPYGIAVYAVLCRYANNETQSCRISASTIAYKIGTGRSTACRELDVLEQAGIIIKETSTITQGATEIHASNLYTLTHRDTWSLEKAKAARLTLRQKQKKDRTRSKIKRQQIRPRHSLDATKDQGTKAKPAKKDWATSRQKRLLERQLAVRDGKKCHYCGIDLILPAEVCEQCIPSVDDAYIVPRGYAIAQIDHKHPKSLGGNNKLENLVLACPSCNGRKGTTLYEDFVKERDFTFPE